MSNFPLLRTAYLFQGFYRQKLCFKRTFILIYVCAYILIHKYTSIITSETIRYKLSLANDLNYFLKNWKIPRIKFKILKNKSRNFTNILKVIKIGYGASPIAFYWLKSRRKLRNTCLHVLNHCCVPTDTDKLDENSFICQKVTIKINSLNKITFNP